MIKTIKRTKGFSKQERLLTPAEYSRVFECAEKSSDRYLTILARVNTVGFPRLGLAISKKSARQAVQRNRIKRVIRESFRSQKHRIPAMDMIVLSKRDVTGASKTQLAASLMRHWIRFQ